MYLHVGTKATKFYRRYLLVGEHTLVGEHALEAQPTAWTFSECQD